MKSVTDAVPVGAAVITGAASGIGAGLARAAAAAGMPVILADIHEVGASRVASEIVSLGGEARTLCTDVTNRDDLVRLADFAFSTYESVGLLANNAGVEAVGLLWADHLAWDRTLAVNLGGIYNGLWAFVPRLLDQGSPAIILNVSSVGALTSGSHQAAYQVSKRAVLALSECLASDLATVRAEIEVVTALPGAVNTEIFRSGPASDPNDIATAEAWKFLCSHIADHGISADIAGTMLFEQSIFGARWATTDPATTAALAVQRAKLLHTAADELVAYSNRKAK